MQNFAYFSGHRPNRFHFGYDENHEDCLRIKALLREWVEFLFKRDVTTFYSGFAVGVDLWASSIMLDLKKNYPNIQLNAAIPFKAQSNHWSQEQQKRYHDLLAQCDHVTILHEKFTRVCYFERNRFMVDNSEYLLAVYDGSKKGGTAYTARQPFHLIGRGIWRTKARPPLHSLFDKRLAKCKNRTFAALPWSQHKQTPRKNPKQPLRHSLARVKSRLTPIPSNITQGLFLLLFFHNFNKKHITHLRFSRSLETHLM